jgi:hypothetical protein
MFFKCESRHSPFESPFFSSLPNLSAFSARGDDVCLQHRGRTPVCDDTLSPCGMAASFAAAVQVASMSSRGLRGMQHHASEGHSAHVTPMTQQKVQMTPFETPTVSDNSDEPVQSGDRSSPLECYVNESDCICLCFCCFRLRLCVQPYDLIDNAFSLEL